MDESSNTSARSLNWLSVCAAVSLVLLFVVGFAASRLSARNHYVSIGRDFHVSLGGMGLNFYSDAQSGPYSGSIIGLAGNPDPIASASNFPFYYRHFRWPNGQVMWTLSIMLPLVLLPFLVLPLVWVWQQIRRFRCIHT